MSSNIKKSYFTGYQAKYWGDILAHSLFSEIAEDLSDQHNYTWLLTTDERAKLTETKQAELIEETLSKLYSIFVTRCHTLFSPDPVLL